MRRVSAREANQQFSRLLNEVEAGDEIIIVRRGHEVARLIPVKVNSDAIRAEAIRQMCEEMNAGHRLGGLRFTRDDMHEP